MELGARLAVSFLIDSQFCSASYRFRFVMDQATLDTATLPNRGRSGPFVTTPGRHGVTVYIRFNPTLPEGVLQDTVVTVIADTTITDRVGVYCS